MEIVGIGTEITECVRIAKLIERHGEQFLHRSFTPQEIHWCQMQAQWIQQYAARWAAKQAVVKALGLARMRGISWPDIEIRPEEAGHYSVGLSGAIKEAAESRGIGHLMVTLSYCRTFATAFAIAFRR